MQPPLQQTKLWQNFLNDLNETSFFKSSKTFTYLAILKSTPFGNYLYCPYGPYSTTENGFLEAIKALKTLAKSKSAIFIRIEPQDPKIAFKGLKQPNIKKVLDLVPAHTMLLDLSPDEKTLVSNFSSTTRNRFNTGPKRGITISTTKNLSDLKYLFKFQSSVANARHFHAFSKSYLEAELKQPFSTLYLAHHNPTDSIVGASLFFDYADTRYYMQSGTDLDPKYKNLSANVSILGQAILDAKQKGLKFFDFWGIAPENAPKNHPWLGFTKFKKTFGGYSVSYCGTHDIIISPLKYKIYHIFRTINRYLRKHF